MRAAQSAALVSVQVRLTSNNAGNASCAISFTRGRWLSSYRHVQDAVAAERMDQRVVEEMRRDVRARAADIRLAAEDHPLHPG
jgi:hypothetical protein